MAKIPKEINPYIGPIPFDHDSKDIFFGRNEEAQKLLSMIFANKIVILFSQSGAGKTSLLNTKIEELLIHEDFKIFKVKKLNVSIDDGVKPKNVYIYSSALALLNETKKITNLEKINLINLLKKKDRRIGVRRFVLIFDQFEEIFTSHLERWQDRKIFLEQINEVCEKFPMSRIIFALREDFLGRLNSYSELWKKNPYYFHLELLNKKKALAAIEGPVKHTNRKYDVGVAEQIVGELLKIKIEIQDLGSNGEANNFQASEIEGEYVEPVQLQIVCKTLWDSLKPDDEQITTNNLQKIGGVEKVLEEFYEESLKKALKDYPKQEKLVRDWFELSLITPIHTRDSFLQNKVKDVGISQQVIDSLVDSYLIRKEERAGARWITLSHDRFIEPIRKSNRKWVEKQLKREHETHDQRIQNFKKRLYTYLGLVLAFLIPIVLIIVFFWLPSKMGSPYERALKYLYEGKQFYEDGRYQEAEESLLSSLNKNQIAEASFSLAKTYSKLNKPEQAIQQFRNTVKVDSTYAEAYFDLGVLLIQNNNVDAGYQKIKKFFELSKSRPRRVLASDLYTLLVLHHFKSRIMSADSSKRCNALEKAIVLTHQHIPYAPMGNSIQHGFDSWGFVSHILREVNVLPNQKTISLQDLKNFNTTINPMPMDLILFPLFNNIILFYLGDFFGEKLCIGVGLTAFVDIIDMSQINYPQSYYHCDYF